MIDESNININLLGGLGENQIPGLTDNEAIFPGSEKLITEFPSNLSSDIAGGEEAIDYSLAILGDSEGANADLTGSDEGETLRATRSKSSAEKVDSLTGEVIETSAIETRSGNSDFIKVEEVFNYGYFVADETGEINIDYLHDGTRPEGELAIFSLEDFDKSFLESE
ncbi:MAG: hypothetical protein SXA11_03555, partial [Cyanobacteriota bacterium]|nr:hypothetical protein [Cyanobacteriota bacterium]